MRKLLLSFYMIILLVAEAVVFPECWRSTRVG